MTDLFNENSEANSDQNASQNKPLDSVLDVFADKLLQIRKEDGTPKYDSIEKALDALAASQAHIANLEGENKTFKEKAQRVQELEELVRTMANGDNNGSEKPSGVTPPVGGLSADDAAKLVRQVLNEEKQVTAAVQNVTNVQNKLVEKFGDEAKAAEAIKSKANELGTTPKQLKELSASNPAMVLALFGGSNSTPSATTSSINTSAFKPPVTTVERPEKSVISGPGATDRNRAELMRKIKADVYKRHGIS